MFSDNKGELCVACDGGIYSHEKNLLTCLQIVYLRSRAKRGPRAVYFAVEKIKEKKCGGVVWKMW